MSIQKQQPEDILTFFRYIRPLRPTKNKSQFGWGRKYDISPTEGLTLKFTIDYNTRVVTVQYAICKSDLFNKRIGQNTIEKFPNRYFSFAYPANGFDQFGIVGYFASSLIRNEIINGEVTISPDVCHQDIKSIFNFIMNA